MIKFGVSSSKNEALCAKMKKYGIEESDIQESFIHSGGKGGQNVNKVATCVRLKHTPTNIEVKCQKSRQQGLNRYLARFLLIKKIEAQILGKKREVSSAVEKNRRQKRKRSKRAKNKMLDNKAHHAKKKQGRKAPKDYLNFILLFFINLEGSIRLLF